MGQRELVTRAAETRFDDEHSNGKKKTFYCFQSSRVFSSSRYDLLEDKITVVQRG